jgi:hypothetical protein
VSRKQPPGTRQGEVRGWLGPAASGGERLARIFQVGQAPLGEGRAAPAAEEIEQELGELRARVSALEQTFPAAHQPPVQHRSAEPLVRIELPHVPLTDDRDRWLSRCDQFAVYAGERLLGTVDGIRYESRADRPDAIEVRGGPFGRRLLVLPVDEVEAVLPDEQAVLVDEAWSGGTAGERLRNLFKQLLATLRPLSP